MKNYFRLIITAFAIAFLFNIFAVSETKAQNPTNEILNRMNEHQKALTSLKANVAMDKYNAQLDEHEPWEGSTKYVKSTANEMYVRLDWSKPQQESLSVVKKQYVIYRPRLNQAIYGNVDDAQKKGTESSSIFDFLKMSKDELKENYKVVYQGKEEVKGGIETWHLELTPKSAKSYKSADIWVDGNGMVLQMKITSNNSDTTTVLLSGLKKNENINVKSEIQISLPKGVTMVKG
ncbi:MAG: outer-membrane lipoprotein carrier protein LolA [Pyrinomonadaceae bacterium]|nr:outer-membrane lipoprotein carrier protein LolA [Pyrinomonadaceae bacterium]